MIWVDCSAPATPANETPVLELEKILLKKIDPSKWEDPAAELNADRKISLRDLVNAPPP